MLQVNHVIKSNFDNVIHELFSLTSKTNFIVKAQSRIHDSLRITQTLLLRYMNQKICKSKEFSSAFLRPAKTGL